MLWHYVLATYLPGEEERRRGGEEERRRKLDRF
jgi:hypothetical protein